MTRAPQSIVFVDGNNVMGSRPDGWWRDRAGAARRLVAEIIPLALGHGGVWTIVFDGKEPPRMPPSPECLIVVHTGHGRRDGADDRIVELVHERSDRAAFAGLHLRRKAAHSGEGARHPGHMGSGTLLSQIATLRATMEPTDNGHSPNSADGSESDNHVNERTTDHLHRRSHESREFEMNGAGTKGRKIHASSHERTHAQSRAVIESPRARDPCTAECEISAATVLRQSALLKYWRCFPFAYGHRPLRNGRHRPSAERDAPDAVDHSELQRPSSLDVAPSTSDHTQSSPSPQSCHEHPRGTTTISRSASPQD